MVNCIISVFDFLRDGIDGISEELEDKIRSYRYIHIDIDLDVLDGSVFQSTEYPIPGGLTVRELIGILYIILKYNVVSVSISEYNVFHDFTEMSKNTIIYILEFIIFFLGRR